jgi:hypothetical protein
MPGPCAPDLANQNTYDHIIKQVADRAAAHAINAIENSLICENILYLLTLWGYSCDLLLLRPHESIQNEQHLGAEIEGTIYLTVSWTCSHFPRFFLFTLLLFDVQVSIKLTRARMEYSSLYEDFKAGSI